jgi:hypothetical protein
VHIPGKFPGGGTGLKVGISQTLALSSRARKHKEKRTRRNEEHIAIFSSVYFWKKVSSLFSLSILILEIPKKKILFFILFFWLKVFLGWITFQPFCVFGKSNISISSLEFLWEIFYFQNDFVFAPSKNLAQKRKINNSPKESNDGIFSLGNR